MRIYTADLSLKSGAKIDLIDITGELFNHLSKSKVTDGIMIAYSPHTTAALIINENEPRLAGDIKMAVKDIISWEKDYAHNLIDSNAPSHIVAAFLGNTLNLPISRGKIELGTWQSVFLLELDGPRSRQVKVKIIGE
ncbi:MAG: secondary thiamine-phosphate synthase enzyme YjbQ [Actinomycetota bacterium]